MADTLMVVDMLNDFCHPDGALYVEDSQRIIKDVAEKIKQYRLERKKIIFVCDRHPEDSPEFKLFPPHCVIGTWGAEVIKECMMIEHDDEIYVSKTTPSGFFETEIMYEINELLMGSFEVCGVCTSICVMQNVIELSYRNFGIIVDPNAVADLTSEAHNFALGHMKNVYGVTIL